MKNRMSRRGFIRTSGLAAAGVLSGMQLNFSRTRIVSGKPNIIFILADDLGYGDLSCYGQKKFKTPNIDQLAAEGMLFTQHYAGSTVCAPSRCSLMTGLHSGHCSVRDNFNKNEERVSLRPEDFTVASMFKAAGYITGMIGKWGLGEPNTTGTPNKKGFDFWYGFLNQARAHNYYPEYIWRNDDKEYLEGNRNGERKTYVHDLFTIETLKFIRENQTKPFFLYLPYTIPHADLDVPDDSLQKYQGKYPEIPYSGNEFATATPKAAYAAMISRMDDDIGKISALTNELGLDGNTLIIFTSDNGPSPKNGNDPGFFSSSGPYRGGKRDLYEGGIRVPFVARWPGKIQPNSICYHISAFWDFLPSMAELTNYKISGNFDGISYLPALLGQEQKSHDYLYWEFTLKNRSFQAIRKDDWKLLRSDKGYELYNLCYDPGEDFNIAHLYPDKVKKLSNMLKSARTKNPKYDFYLD